MPAEAGDATVMTPPAELGGLNAGALFAHVIASVKSPGASAAGARGWTRPTIAELQRMLPQYAISEMLGRGGMGAVYKGVQRSLDRTVAIKTLPPGIEDAAVHYIERSRSRRRRWRGSGIAPAAIKCQPRSAPQKVEGAACLFGRRPKRLVSAARLWPART